MFNDESPGVGSCYPHAMTKMPEMPATYNVGLLTVENAELIAEMNLTDCQFGLQIADDGRVWVCVNSVAFLRFKPATLVPTITTKVPTDRVLADLTDAPLPEWK